MKEDTKRQGSVLCLLAQILCENQISPVEQEIRNVHMDDSALAHIRFVEGEYIFRRSVGNFLINDKFTLDGIC